MAPEDDAAVPPTVARLSSKPVLEWTPEEWAAWIEGAKVRTEPEPEAPPEPAASNGDTTRPWTRPELRDATGTAEAPTERSRWQETLQELNAARTTEAPARPAPAETGAPAPSPPPPPAEQPPAPTADAPPPPSPVPPPPPVVEDGPPPVEASPPPSPVVDARPPPPVVEVPSPDPGPSRLFDQAVAEPVPEVAEVTAAVPVAEDATLAPRIEGPIKAAPFEPKAPPPRPAPEPVTREPAPKRHGPVTRARRPIRSGDPAWLRIRSAVVLAVLAIVVGAMVALGIALLIAGAASMLRHAVA